MNRQKRKKVDALLRALRESIFGSCSDAWWQMNKTTWEQQVCEMIQALDREGFIISCK